METLPNDGGYLLGAQVGLWRNRGTNRPAIPRSNGTHTERSFVNIFACYARGLAAYDTFDAPFRRGRTVPQATARVKRSSPSAPTLSTRSSASSSAAPTTVVFATPTRTPSAVGAFNEGAINIRPQLFFGDFAGRQC